MYDHELVINDATCSGCGYARDECECDVIDWNEEFAEFDDDRNDYLPLPPPTVPIENERTDDDDKDFMRRMFEFEENERKTHEENLRRVGLSNNELLVPPPIMEILVNERRAELASIAERQAQNRQPRTSTKGHSPDGLTYPML